MSLRRRSRWIAVAIVAASNVCAATALAHSNGQASGGCGGCHASADYAISAATSPAGFSPGDQVTVTVTIASPGGAVAGIFIEANGGALSTIGGQGLAVVNQGLSHSAPKAMQSGSVSFAFGWAAPDRPGAVRFELSTLVGNGNGSSKGDKASSANVDFVYGCEPFTYFRDADGDGHGQDDNTMIHCVGTPPKGYSAAPGDCNDNNGTIFPGAIEVCNTVDDDCNRVVDDDAIPLDLYIDEDGDGFYGTDEFYMGAQEVGCVPAKGLAGYGGDCEPTVAEISPGAVEVCNLIDDDCDQGVDEKVRPRCGEGWCAREAPTCEPASCEPGEPLPEECNLMDDDCDTIVDEDTPCDPGLACVVGKCVEAAPAPAAPSAGAADGACAVSDRPSSVLAGALCGLSLAWLLRRRATSVRARRRS